VSLEHFRDGPTIEVGCGQFEVKSIEETRLFHKTISGWESMATTAFALSELPHELTIDTYVRQHVIFFLDQSRSSSSWLDAILKRGTEHATVSK
jgi:hypothetical protein